MDFWEQVLADDDRAISDAKAHRDASRVYSQDHRRWAREVDYLERKRAKHVRERDRAAREGAAEQARLELQIARAEARAEQARAREIARWLPTGAEIRDAHRLRVVPSGNRNHAHGARRRRLLALLRRTARAEELGASARQVEWARACIQIALDMRPGRVELGAELVLPYLQCAECGRVNCDHHLDLEARRPA